MTGLEIFMGTLIVLGGISIAAFLIAIVKGFG